MSTTTKSIAVKSLACPDLDYWVAVADGRLNPQVVGDRCLFTHGEGGPVVRWDAAFFFAQVMPREFPGVHPAGREAIESLMRTFVERKLGATVGAPDVRNAYEPIATKDPEA